MRPDLPAIPASPGTPVGFNEFEGGGGDDTITGAINSQGAPLTRVSYVSAGRGRHGRPAPDRTRTAAGDAAKSATTRSATALPASSDRTSTTPCSAATTRPERSRYSTAAPATTLINGRGGFDRADYNNDPDDDDGHHGQPGGRHGDGRCARSAPIRCARSKPCAAPTSPTPTTRPASAAAAPTPARTAPSTNSPATAATTPSSATATPASAIQQRDRRP